MARSLAIVLSLLVFASSAFSQKLKKADKAILANLETHIRFLADDKLEGRRAGTNGEKLASDYISSEFQKAGLEMIEDKSWLQPFDIDDGKQIDYTTNFTVNNNELELNKDYFPLAFSATKKVSGSLAIALQESGVPWFVDIKEMLEENKDNPHFDLDEALHTKTKECKKNGATAIVFFNSSKIADNISFNKKDKSETEAIPVLYVTADAKKKYFKDESASLDVKINVAISEKKRTGNNVVGYINNGSDKTIILGAHYDHLGYGEDGNSMYRGTDKEIHNGADDNASGTAALIELAKLLKQSKFKNNNYLFIAFSGEELGLFGSKYFVEHPAIDLKKVNYMINMDMVGRLNDSSHVLTIGGYGTSPEWGELFNINKSEKKYFKFNYDSSGTGPSDHTSFYRKDIPVLFFFTGLHKDYHRPSDDYDKINYTGELHIVKYVYQLMEDLNDKGKLAFTKTRETQTTTSARFSVTLGIMPDYTFSGAGVRVDGVSDGRPAQKAGLQTGDVIIQLGDYNVSSLENYMQALSKFKKGDATKVKYKRGNDVSEAAVQF
ncbi:MAG TPA: M20/M25/M40 family metallo-hydrolase [Puia sp.]|nr:M20/M25/M40 family metallo-hydrolase [Puia sp.]